MPLYDFGLSALRGYRSEVAPPDDFDAFWSATLAEARTQARPARFERAGDALKLVEAFDVTFTGFGGHPIRAWLIMPRERAKPLRDPYPEIVRYLAVHRDKVDDTLNTLRYFDGVCFGARSRASALFSVAMMDTICPPSTIFAAFNAFAGADKTIREYGFNDHEGGGGFQESAQLALLAERLGG